MVGTRGLKPRIWRAPSCASACVRIFFTRSCIICSTGCGRRRLSQIVLAALHVRHDGGDQLVAVHAQVTSTPVSPRTGPSSRDAWSSAAHTQPHQCAPACRQAANRCCSVHHVGHPGQVLSQNSCVKWGSAALPGHAHSHLSSGIKLDQVEAAVFAIAFCLGGPV
jgi:hypothetical protein